MTSTSTALPVGGKPITEPVLMPTPDEYEAWLAAALRRELLES